MDEIKKFDNPKKNQFLEKLKSTMGNISEACKASGISRQTYYDWIEADTEFKAECNEVSENSIDYVESALLKNIKKGDTTAIIFFLKTRGKKRGYVETQEIITDDKVAEKALQQFEKIYGYHGGES